MSSVRTVALERSFGNVRALQGLSLEIPEGCVGLLGPNGAGKSTLLKILMGLLEPDSGEAHVLGIDVTADPAEVRRIVGYMPEMDAYLPGLTGAEAVRFAGVMCGLPSGEAQRRAHEILYYVGLGEARYRRAEEYSTGMRQRLRLAQAIVHDPKLVFLDEPTNGLDPKGRDEILALVRDLAEKHGKSVVLCSHLLPDVEAVCPRVVMLREGRVALEGSVEDVRRLERGMFRVRYVGDRGRFEASLRERRAELRAADGEDVTVQLAEPCDPRDVFLAAAAAGGVVRSLSSSAQNLEGAFLRAVGESAGEAR
ncbi:MAG: Vitamin B12 import ATP-binding protein BtuD [Planctomycetes bacterium]|nr:Vitamin B12 import ATP-binding protein BtuD [Planctomycetota bacterium]